MIRNCTVKIFTSPAQPLGGTHGLWLTAPVIGMAACAAMILSGNYGIMH